MIRTKHLCVAVVLIVGGLISFLVLLLVVGDSTTDLEGREDVVFKEGENEYEALVAENGSLTEARESLIAKLGVYESEEDETFTEETVEPEPEATNARPQGGYPVGDGNISTSPRLGWIYSCEKTFNASDALATGDWFSDGYWYPDQKVTVDGSVLWEGGTAITKAEGARLVTTNGLPDHTTGVFPIRTSDDAYQYDRNPNKISAQNVLLQLPLNPTLASSPSCVSLGMIGIGLNGVAIFNGLDGQGLDAAAREIQDSCGGHPGRTGTYHYHNESDCLIDSYYEGAPSTIVGYALDGLGIFSSNENGVTLTNDNLDVCHGHTHDIPWDGVAQNMYHYHMTKEYPYTLGCFMGKPVEVAGASDFPTGDGPPLGGPQGGPVPQGSELLPPGL